MPPAEFEHTIPASEQRQTYVLDGAATGIGRNERENYTLYEGNTNFVNKAIYLSDIKWHKAINNVLTQITV